jgi:eukaryotic-like serine/threonine-protein kinase
MDPLATLPAFRTLDDEDRADLLARCERRTYAPGTAIVRRGEPGDAMYVLLEGQAEVPILDEQGRRRMTAFLGPGDVFGEMALLTGEARGADVVVAGETEAVALYMPKAEVEEVLRAHPSIARFLTEILGKRLLESGQLRKVGKYHLVGELGRGGVAIVYEGLHPQLNRAVAVKMLSHELVYEADFAARFLREAEIVAELSHESIVQVFDAEQAFATFFIIMERLQGEDLKQRLQRTGPLAFDEARRVLREVASALGYAHKKGVVHKDIKPSNIFLDDVGRTKITDFGIAASARLDQNARGRRAAQKGVLGTPGYIAPEVLLGHAVDHRVDVYALGVAAYEMLTGLEPFAAAKARAPQVEIFKAQLTTPYLDLKAALRDAPDDLVELVRRATAREPRDRFDDMGQMQALLDARVRAEDLDGFALNVFVPPHEARRARAILDEAAAKLDGIDGARFALAETPRPRAARGTSSTSTAPTAAPPPPKRGAKKRAADAG